MNKAKGLGKKLKTLRSGISATPATLHLEITMLLHQQRRLHSELETIKERETHLLTLLNETTARIEELNRLAEGLDPLGRKIPQRASTCAIMSSIPSSIRNVDSPEKASITNDKETKNSSSNFREMSLSY